MEATEPTTFNLADLWEAVWPRVAERTALACGERTVTYAELDDRADRLARWFSARGVGPGDHKRATPRADREAADQPTCRPRTTGVTTARPGCCRPRT